MSHKDIAEVFAADESRDHSERAHVAALLTIAASIEAFRSDLLAAIERAEQLDREQDETQLCGNNISYTGVLTCCVRPEGHAGLHMNAAGLLGGGPGVSWTS